MTVAISVSVSLSTAVFVKECATSLTALDLLAPPRLFGICQCGLRNVEGTAYRVLGTGYWVLHTSLCSDYNLTFN